MSAVIAPRTYIFPSQWRFTALAINVGNSVESRQQNALFRLSASDIHSVDGSKLVSSTYVSEISFHLHRVEEISASLAALERLRDQLIVRCQMRPTVNARIRSIRRRQIRLKCLHHPAAFLVGCNDFTGTDSVARRVKVCCFDYKFLKGLRLSPSGVCLERFSQTATNKTILS